MGVIIRSVVTITNRRFSHYLHPRALRGERVPDLRGKSFIDHPVRT